MSPTHPSSPPQDLLAQLHAANTGARETQTEATRNFTAPVCCTDPPQVLRNQDMVQGCPLPNITERTTSSAFSIKPQSQEPRNYLLTELSVLFLSFWPLKTAEKSPKHYSSAPCSLKNQKPSRNNGVKSLLHTPTPSQGTGGPDRASKPLPQGTVKAEDTAKVPPTNIPTPPRVQSSTSPKTSAPQPRVTS